MAGDFNSDAIWDQPGWRINHTSMVEILAIVGALQAIMSSVHREVITDAVGFPLWAFADRVNPVAHRCLDGTKD